jgi:Ferredoxin-like domain in Api92-like protein
MPNWNQNSVIITHEDPTQIDRLVEGFKNKRLFGEFLPCPKELLDMGSPLSDAEQAEANVEKYGAADWHQWCINNWGTKWDVGEESDGIDRVDDNKVKLSFDTAWGPPVSFYEYLDEELDFGITAFYLEEGMGFVGKYTSEEGDENFNFDGSEDLEDIPEDICEHWDLAGICELRGDWEDDDADDDFDDDATDPDTESGDGTAPSDEKS